jgi:tetratricopeptide (TPR) repeat protein
MSDDEIFTTAGNEYVYLGRIAKHFFQELQTFGVLTSCDPLSDEVLNLYVDERAGFIRSFLKLLEKACDLRFSANSNVPFCYNVADWSDAAPIAEYSGGLVEVRPSEVAATLILNGAQRVKGTIHLRLITCALERLRTTDLQDTLTYLFDLHQAGFAGADELLEVSVLLLAGRAQVGSDAELFEQILGHRLTSGIDLRRVELTLDWIHVGPLHAEGKAILSALFDRASLQVGKVRDADDLDAWVVGQAYILGLLTTVRNLIEEFIPEVPLPWRARLSQWEEIEADAGSMFDSASKRGFDTLTPQFRSTIAKLMGEIFRNQVGIGWEERFYRERLLVPTALRRQLLSPDDLPMPSEWEHPSWRVIYPWTIGIKRDKSPHGIRVVPLLVDELIELDGVRQAMLMHGISEPEQQRLVLTGCLSGSQEDIMAALREVVSQRDTLAELLESSFDTIYRLEMEHRYEDAADHARQTAQRYPYLPQAYLELAISLDLQGYPEFAIEQLIPAVFLAPTEPLNWQSLSVVLGRLGKADEAHFASAFKELLERQDRI